MDEIKRSKSVILFIDELHTIVGAGAAEGAMDASNIFKPGASRGELQCIGATTLNEYRKYIEKDSALDRRFQSDQGRGPVVDDTVLILKGIRGKYEDHHKATFTDKALEAAAKLSDRYITGRFLPDKAIDVMDEAGSRARISALSRPPDGGVEQGDRVRLRAEGGGHFQPAFRGGRQSSATRRSSSVPGWSRSPRSGRSSGRRTPSQSTRTSCYARGRRLDRHPAVKKKENEKLLQLESELQNVSSARTRPRW